MAKTFRRPKTPGYERRASPVEREIVKAMIETNGSTSAVAKMVDVDPTTVRRVMKREPVLRFYMSALAEAGIDAKAIATVLKDALSADKAVYIYNKGVPEEIVTPDHRTRLIAVDQITKTAMALRDIDKSLEQPDTSLPPNADQMTDVELAKLMTKRLIKRDPS